MAGEKQGQSHASTAGMPKGPDLDLGQGQSSVPLSGPNGPTMEKRPDAVATPVVSQTPIQPVQPRHEANKQRLRQIISTHLPDNHVGAITAEKLREVLNDIVDEM